MTKTRKLITFFVIATSIYFAAYANATSIQWRWLTGVSTTQSGGTYGSRGVFSAVYTPGGRSKFALTAADDTLYIYGGNGYVGPAEGLLGDLWAYRQSKWTSNGEWAWIGGKSDSRNCSAQAGNPPCKESAVLWQHNGTLFLFGGRGYDINSEIGMQNDIWGYNTNWTFIRGSVYKNPPSVMGGKGDTSIYTSPGGNAYPMLLDTNGSEVLVFGGEGLIATPGLLSDTWCYNSTNNTWTWINGPGQHSMKSKGGNSLVFNSNDYYPGGRRSCAIARNGNLVYSYGGFGWTTVSTSASYLGDLWAYNTSMNAWGFIIGDSAAVEIPSVYTEYPGAREASCAWIDPNSGLYMMMGGLGYVEGSSVGELSDIWVLNTTDLKWRWVGGKSTLDENGVYLNHWFNPEQFPGSRIFHGAAVVARYGQMYLFGGQGKGGSTTSGKMNDMWTTVGIVAPVPTPTPTPMPTPTSTPTPTPLRPIAWRYLGDSLDKRSIGGPSGQYSSTYAPGARQLTAMAADATSVYIFGGLGYATTDSPSWGNLGDLWNYRQSEWSSVGEWAYIVGRSDTINYIGGANYPGARYGSAMWVDDGTMVYIHGGFGYGTISSMKSQADLWRFDITTPGSTFTWIKGSKDGNTKAVYGTIGVSSNGNIPGALRYHGVFKPGMFFGGHGFDHVTSIPAALADVWTYDTAANTWTYINGPSAIDKYSIVGSKLQFAAAYHPGGRYNFAVMGHGEYVYLFGGDGYSVNDRGDLADLWCFHDTALTKQWAFIGGESATKDVTSTYGTKMIYSPSTHPSSRAYSVGWSVEVAGTLMMFGGLGLDTTTGSIGRLDDLFAYNTTSMMWAWIGGDSVKDTNGAFAQPDWFSSGNHPGSRHGAKGAYCTGFGLLVMFGGYGKTKSAGLYGYLNDIWTTTGLVETPTLPVSTPTPIPSTTPLSTPLSTPSSTAPTITGYVISTLTAATVVLPSVLQQVAQGTGSKSMSIGDVVDVLQFVAFTSQLSIPLSDTYVAFASSFTWCLPVISAPFEFVSKAASRRLLSLTQVFGSDAKHAALNYLPSLLFWAVIGLVCVFLYVFLIDMLRYALKKGRRYVRDKETGEVIAYWRRSLGMFLRFLVMIYYAMCYATLYALSLTSQWAGVFAMAIISLILICLGIPVLCAVLVYKARVQQDMFDDKQTLTLFGSLFAGYRMDRYWFTIPILAQKFMLALSVAVVLDGSAQMSIILVVLLLVLIAMVLAKPHESPAMLKLWIAYASVRILIVVILFVSSFLMHQSSRDVLGVTAIILQVLGVVVTAVIFIRPFIADLKLNESGPSWLRKRETVDMSERV